MLVDTNTVDKTVSTEAGTVRIQIYWKNVDGHSVERVRVQGTCDGMSGPVVAEWDRHGGQIKTRFSAPVVRPAEFVLRLLSMAADLSVPEDSAALFSRAVEDLTSKTGKMEARGSG